MHGFFKVEKCIWTNEWTHNTRLAMEDATILALVTAIVDNTKDAESGKIFTCIYCLKVH